jgi:2-phosphosulfolactate phosphatase
MIIRIVEGVEGARAARGVVVIIDVMRAFTTAAHAFGAGISEIVLVSTVEEALAIPGFRMGEVGGRLIPGFDHNHSPSRLVGRRLRGRAVMRTGSGTQCVAEATGASEVWLASLVVASATASALRGSDAVTLVASGAPGEGEEDLACAEFIAALLEGRPHAHDAVRATVEASRAAARHKAGDADFPLDDVACASAIDAFDFAMKAEKDGGHWIARPYSMPQ